MINQSRGVITFDNLDRTEKPCFSQLFIRSFYVWCTCNLLFLTYNS